jgi:hypothetical protein
MQTWQHVEASNLTLLISLWCWVAGTFSITVAVILEDAFDEACLDLITITTS